VALQYNTTLRDAFLAETEVSLNAVLVLTSALNSDFILFNIPRLKFTGWSKDDKSQALVQTLPFQALLNKPPAPEVFVPAFAAWPAALRRSASPATLQLAQRPTLN